VPAARGRTISVATTPAISPSGCPTPQLAGIDLEWQIGDGAPHTIALADHGGTWSATIPAQPEPTVVRYRVIARIDDGGSVVFPDNPADPLYQLFAGEAAPIWCDRLDVAPAWTATGSWEYQRPRGNGGDPDLAHTGEAFLGTDIIGNGLYPSNETATITTPPIDATAFARVHVQLRRWLTVEPNDRARILVAGVPVWENATAIDHVDREWRFVDIEVPPGTFDITWSLAADAERVRGGWNLDDVCVVGVGPLDCAEPPCLPPAGDAGCCSTSGGDPRGLAVLAACVLLVVRRRREALLQ
jgi:hypothetical protein